MELLRTRQITTKRFAPILIIFIFAFTLGVAYLISELKPIIYNEVSDSLTMRNGMRLFFHGFTLIWYLIWTIDFVVKRIDIQKNKYYIILDNNRIQIQKKNETITLLFHKIQTISAVTGWSKKFVLKMKAMEWPREYIINNIYDKDIQEIHRVLVEGLEKEGIKLWKS